MRALALSLLIGIVALGNPALAQRVDVTGVKITWFGNFTSAHVKTIDDPTIATRERFTETGVVPPNSNTDRINLSPNSAFGFGFTLSGRPSDGVATLKEIYKYPSPGITSDSGSAKFTDTVTYDFAINRRDLYMGYRLGDDVTAMPAGLWLFQIFVDDNLLVEKTFTLVRR